MGEPILKNIAKRRHLFAFRKYLKLVNRVGKSVDHNFVQSRRAVVLLFCALYGWAGRI